ncbi:Putative methyltransferase [Seminavis robusta]|uniref:Methyltransferase n=1 Tax=Seminavis robusta TaxID=568900 RepID=A0A9N8E000_9STRA|nr:Putative methyltransferase [Seminavis robusta]|eukprot:Sro514_g158010.1 Putative methyltransferase (273) ;mRNA; r:18815-19633
MKLPLLRTGAALKIAQADGVIGGKIWPAASALCDFIAHHLPPQHAMKCVELGSGTGAVGIYAAATLGCSMTLTEHRPPRLSVIPSVPYAVDGTPEFDAEEYQDDKSDRLLNLLQWNVDQNAHLFDGDNNKTMHILPRVAELDWNETSHAQQLLLADSAVGFDLILGSDVTYVSQLHQPLADTIASLLRASPSSSSEPTRIKPKCFISHQQRVLNLRGHDFQLVEFERALLQAGLSTVNILPFPVTEGSTTHKVSILEIQHGNANGGNQIVLQ